MNKATRTRLDNNSAPVAFFIFYNIDLSDHNQFANWLSHFFIKIGDLSLTNYLIV